MLKIKRWILIFTKTNKNATHREEEHCMTNFCANSTEVENQKKQKVVGRDGSIQQFLPPQLQVAPVPKGDS